MGGDIRFFVGFLVVEYPPYIGAFGSNESYNKEVVIMIISGSRCYNNGYKHKFKARYDEKPYPGRIEGSSRSILYYQVYVKDVCVWCGKEVKK